MLSTIHALLTHDQVRCAVVSHAVYESFVTRDPCRLKLACGLRSSWTLSRAESSPRPGHSADVLDGQSAQGKKPHLARSFFPYNLHRPRASEHQARGKIQRPMRTYLGSFVRWGTPGPRLIVSRLLPRSLSRQKDAGSWIRRDGTVASGETDSLKEEEPGPPAEGQG